MKKIGFLSFGHWTPSPQSQTRSGADALLQSIDLAVAAEELGADGAYFRVHHFARQLGSPFPLLAACGAKTKHDRDRHRGHRHALREPAVHGGGCRRGRPHRRRTPATRHQPRLARAGDRRLALLRLRPAARGERCRHGAAPHRGVPRGAARRGLRAAEPAPDVPQPAGPAARRAAFGGPARPHLVGRRLQRHRGLGREARHEPAELDAQDRRERTSRSTSSRPSRSGRSARRGRRPGTRASRACR